MTTTTPERKRVSDPFWRQCFTAALTGLTVAGAVRLGSRPLEDDGEGTTALAPVPQVTPENMAKLREELEQEEHLGYREMMVQEAAAIADAALDLTKGPMPERDASAPLPLPDRPALNTIGNVPVFKP
jgi:hypothetical protein